jgi:DNA processing protein
VIVGGMDGVGEEASAGAIDRGGAAIGVPAEGILNVSRRADIRRRVHDGSLCLVSPYPPKARPTAVHETGRTKIIHALSRATFVASSDNGRGRTWVGAVEALDHGYGVVAAWAGDGVTDGNRALIRRGAVPITTLAQLFSLDPTIRRPPTDDTLF